MGEHVVGVLLQRRAGEDLRPRRGLHAGPGHIELGEVMEQVVVDHGGADVQVDHDPGGELFAVGVGGRVPVRVFHQRELLVQLIVLELVRAGGDRVQLVVRAGVFGRRHRHRLRQRRHVVEVGERFLQVEHDRGRVRCADRGQAQPAGRGVLVRAAIAGVVQQHREVAGAVGQHVLGVAALDGVLDVPARDRAAILEPDAGLEVIGPGQAVVADPAQAGRQVRHQPQAGGAGRGPVCHQRPAVETDDVPHIPVVGVAGIGRVRDAAAVIEDDRPARTAGGIDHRAERGVISRRGALGACSAAAAGRKREGCRHPARGQRYCASSLHRRLPPCTIWTTEAQRQRPRRLRRCLKVRRSRARI